MKVFGREVRFLRTVEANFKIDEISPDNDMNNLAELLDSSNVSTSLNVQAQMICILNEAYEKRQKFIDPNYESHPITMEEIMMLDNEEFTQLSDECLKAMAGKSTVELEASKKKENQ